MANYHKRIPYSRTLVALAISALTPLASSQMLEEVIITAQKRAESAQDVPVSVNAVSGDFIAKNGIETVEQMSELVPNFHIGSNPSNSSISMRGLGSGSDRSFEQSVGLFVDGIFAGRAALFQVPFLDVERVEVLRGAQGVLFGKNSIAGAVAIHSAKPSDEFYAEISGSYEFEYDQHDVTGVVSGGLTDNLFARFVINTKESGNWLNDISSGKDTTDRQTDAYRLSLLWDASDTTEVFFKAEKSDLEVTGPSYQLELEPGSQADALNTLSTPDLGALAAGGNRAAGQLFSMRQGGEDFNYDDDITSNNGPVIEQDTETYVLQVKHLLGEHELTYLMGYAEYDRLEVTDSDFTSFDFIAQTYPIEYEQITHELRIASPGGETFDYVAGIFYVDRDYEISPAAIDFNAGPLAITSRSTYKENTESWSGFGQLTWNITDTFRASLGARYSVEDKEATKDQILTDFRGSNQLSVVAPPLYGAIISLLPFSDFNFVGDRTEKSLDPALNFQWDVTDGGMAYLSLTKATKSGGFASQINLDREATTGGTSNPDAGWEFEEESAKSIEVGLKTEYWDGRARSNLAIFYTKFDDLQVSSFDPRLGTFVTGNAAKAITRGFELENTFAVADEWTVGANLAYLDAYYDAYVGSCPTSSVQIAARPECAAGSETYDLSGESFKNAAEWSVQFFTTYENSLTDRINLSARLDAAWSDDYQANTHDLALLNQDDFWKLNLRVALNATDDSWTVALVGNNLTDEQLVTGGGESFGLPGAYWKNRTKGREFRLQATYRFY